MSLYTFLDRYVFLPVGDRLNHSNVVQQYKALKDNDWKSKSELDLIQNQKLLDLLKHCYENVPYYTKLFNQLNLKPEDIKCRQDLAKLPILTKQIIRDNYEDLQSKDISSRKYRQASTGGSTGTPLKFMSDFQAWSIQKASSYRAWEWYGFHFGEKIFSLGGSSLVKKGMKKKLSLSDLYEKFIMRNYKYSSAGMTDDDMARYYKAFMKLKPSAIRGYASSLVVFARYIEANKLPVYPIKLILTTGEKLMPEYRAKLQQVFRVPVYDAYGAGDGGIVSHECYMHEGLHISEECCAIEITDKEGNVLPDGEMGFVTTTDLENYSFPFIRYQVGDMSYIKKDKCSCGRESRLFGEILGRAGKLLYSKNGSPISPTMLPILLYRDLDYHDLENQKIYNKIDKFQMQQDEKGDLKIVIKLKDKDEDQMQFDYIIDNFKGRFAGSKIELLFVDDIPPMPSGKEDYCISMYNYNF